MTKKILFFIVNSLIFAGHIISYPIEEFAKSLWLQLTAKKTRKLLKNRIGSTVNFITRIPLYLVEFASDFVNSKIKLFVQDVSKIYRVLRLLVADVKIPQIKFQISPRKKPAKIIKKGEKRRPIQKPARKHARKPTRKSTITFRYRLKIWAITFFLVTIAFGLGALSLYSYSWYRKLPQPDLLKQAEYNKSTKILDREGRLLYEIYIDKKYDPVKLGQVPEHVVNATLAIEDAEFFNHKGIRPISMIRAARSTIFENELQGASTITQQLIKNVLLTPERTISRKVKELVLAVMVEQQFTKNEILELYLNNIPYGGTAYGIQSASQKYFGKDVGDLSLAEASMLAGLPTAPSAYSPVQGNEDLAKKRQKMVLSRMIELDQITRNQAEEAYSEELKFVTQAEFIRAPHFVTMVRKELYETYGERTVDFGGMTVTTSLDLDVQEKVQEIVTREVERNSHLNFTNGAAVVMDSRTGQIIAYVGSIDYFSDSSGEYDVVTAYRQPGSSIKPITYALAFEKGLTPATSILDGPVTYQSYGQVYSPKNYDNKFHGTVSLRQALANSYNVPAVKLLNHVGMDEMVQLGRNFGFKNWNVGDGSYGLSVTLGGKEVRLLDLTNAYATFSRSGSYVESDPFVSIRDIYGFELHKSSKRNPIQIIKEETAYLITHVLSDNGARSSAFGPNSKLVIPNHTVAVKTGTTNDIRDNLTVGYTPSYTVGVWVGNNDNTPMNSRLASGLSGAAPIWNEIMVYLLEDTPNEIFLVPEGIIVKTDKDCGYSEIFDKDSKVPSTLCPKDDGDKDKKSKKDKKNSKDD